MNEKITGRGKRHGATSFSKISLKELNRVLRGNAIVVVSRRFAENLGLVTKPFQASTENLKNATTPDPEFTVE